ncbi:hypothetical protein ACFVFQ_24990 [Streptomyces sp. NPDC057743]|uniref:hypothetical protein n=1 Tax=Streptomyces sp. NPDC057743 TaxID=3346236 RepID=UPI003695AFCA
MPRTKTSTRKHTARRQAKYRADARMRMAAHAASQILNFEWDGRRPVKPGQVIAKTSAMYGNCHEVRDQAITPAEARAALDHVLSR